MRVKFGVLEQTQGLHLHAIFHLNVFIVSASGNQKPQFLGKFWAFGLMGQKNENLHQENLLPKKGMASRRKILRIYV